MTFKQIVEMVEVHHPHIGGKEMELLINRIQRDISRKTKLLSGSGSFTTTAGTRHYDLDTELTPDKIMSVKKVAITDGDGDKYYIPQSAGRPLTKDA